jgi:hypothetical protein
MKLNVANKIIFKNRKVIILLTCSFLFGCQKTVYIKESVIKPIKVIQKPATAIQPAQFYLCGNDQYPCARKALPINTTKDHLPIYPFKPKGVVNEKRVTDKNAYCK